VDDLHSTQMFQAEEGQSLHLISAKKGGPDPPEENETNLGELRVAVGQETHSQDNCWMSLLMLSKRHSSTTDMESIALGAQELRSMLEWDGIVNKDAVREKKGVCETAPSRRCTAGTVW
jgi:hypothetical protein